MPVIPLARQQGILDDAYMLVVEQDLNLSGEEVTASTSVAAEVPAINGSITSRSVMYRSGYRWNRIFTFSVSID